MSCTVFLFSGNGMVQLYELAIFFRFQTSETTQHQNQRQGHLE